ncbi:MAG: hypothetical protein FOGNACKC_01713 [Anaerolineae bacterium]|nr:hypothetical protein [Anaerolineae bacterium]
MSNHDNKTIIKQALANFNRPENRETYFDIYHPNCEYAGVGTDLKTIKQFYNRIFVAFPNAKVTPESMVAENDKVVVRYTFTGTHQGELMGIPPSGKPVSVSGMSILRFANGKCIQRWSQTDFLGILQQVGAIPGPQAG